MLNASLTLTEMAAETAALAAECHRHLATIKDARSWHLAKEAMIPALLRLNGLGLSFTPATRQHGEISDRMAGLHRRHVRGEAAA